MIITDKKQKSFVLYADFESALLRLSMKERGMLFTMIYSYVNRGCIDSFEITTPLVDMAFAVIRAQLDRDREKYEKICARNAENGKRGGRPKTQWVFEKPKKAYNDNKNDSDSDSVSDSDNKLDIGRSFDVDDFFAAAVARSYGETEEK